MDHGERTFKGIPVSPGIAIGRAWLVDRKGAVAANESIQLTTEDVEPEIKRFEAAIQLSREQLAKIRRNVAERLDEKHADIFMAQAEFLNDDMLIAHTVSAIRTEKRNAEYLFNRRVSEFLTLLSSVEDEAFKAKNSDVLDIATRVTNNLLRQTAEEEGPRTFPADTVLVGLDLMPSETTALRQEQVIGFVLEKGGPTSHTAIMAKAHEIPAIVGAAGIVSAAAQGAPIIIDGAEGYVVVNPTPETLAIYERRRIAFTEEERELDRLRDEPAETVDGYMVELRGNVELPEEIPHLAAHGACGIGLFRTEFMFMNRTSLPDEEEQFAAYSEVIKAAAPHPAVLRTLDFGGDKMPSADASSLETNPFMGQRAIRLCLAQPELFRKQLRAMLRASAFGKARILLPMISGVEEFLEAKSHFRAVKGDLKKEGIAFDKGVKLGAMIEVPSAAVVAEDLARYCDFFSIGTNDLIQYTLAVDRGNERVAYLYEPLHPSILRLLKGLVQAARRGGIPVSVCGEVASDPMMAVLLLGMGIDELSMSAVSIPHVKKVIRSVTLTEAKLLVEEILKEATIVGIKKIIRRKMKKYLRPEKFRMASAERQIVGVDQETETVSPGEYVS